MEQKAGAPPPDPDPAPPYDSPFYHPVPGPNGQQRQPYPQQVPPVFSAQQNVAQVKVIHVDNLRAQSTYLRCPKCNADVHTRITFVTGRMTHIAAYIICAFGCLCGCCFIPYYMNSCRDVQHECPNCNYFIGNFRR